MKRFFSLALVALVSLVGARAATPTFQSFHSNDFVVLPSLAQPQTIQSRIHGGGAFDTPGSSIWFTNIYATNIYTTNLYITTNTYVTINSMTNAVGLWIETNGFLMPVHFDLPVLTDTIQDGTLVVTNLNSGGVVISDATGAVTNLFVGTGALTNDGAGNLGWFSLAGFPTTNYWKIAGGNLTPQDAALPVEVDSSIVFGPGTTNVLYRYGNVLTYSNSVTATVNLIGGAHTLGLVATAGYNQVGGVQPLNLSGGSTLGSVALSDTDFSPANGFLPLGKTGGQWGSLTIGGFDDLSGVNYSQFKLSHTGTNGAVVFDSQAAGIAGAARHFDFKTNSVIIASIATSGAITNDNTNGWIFKGVTEGATTNIVVNINGKDYTFQAW